MLDAEAIRRWARGLVVALEAERDALDRINVYPVADSDTGTNLVHTSRAALAEVERSSSAVVTDVLQAMATGALGGARGNSGMLLSQVVRGLAQGVRSGAGDRAQAADGHDLRRALATAAVFAREAMSEPVDGTLLSVLGAAAEAVEAVVDPDASVVARAAVTASAVALERTPAQLRPLADAGVVDAGGRGLVIVLDLLHAALYGGRRIAPTPPDPGKVRSGERVADLHESRYAYEVMYSLSGVDGTRSAELREELNGLGDCVSVVEDGAGSWAVHVHCDDIGTAIEAGIEVGRVHRINVTRFVDQQGTSSHPGQDRRADRAGGALHADTPGQLQDRARGKDSVRMPESAILACVTAEELAELFRTEGAVAVLSHAEAMTEGELGAAIRATRAEHIVVLPNDSTLTETAERAARETRDGRRDVVVVPTASPVQGLAALAVHDATRTRSEDTVAMAEAAAATRRGELVVAEHEALTWAGRCQAGDVLGLVDGDVVLIDTDVTQAATTLADRMLVAGGELVTALASVDRQVILDALSAHLRRTHPEVEVTQLHCGPAGALLLLGVE